LPILRQLALPSVFFITGECLRRDSLPLTTVSRTYAPASASVAWEPPSARMGDPPGCSRSSSRLGRGDAV
jgi:hypothetical protein